MSKSLQLPCDVGQVSDGYHTFDELYQHRCALFAALMLSHPELSWVAKKHSDGSEIEGWFIAGMHLPSGDISYHLPNEMYHSFIELEVPIALKWDGHTSTDVIRRLTQWWSRYLG